MASLFNSKKEVNKVTFSEKLKGVKSMFQEAHDKAALLNKEMQEEIACKQSMIESLQAEVQDIKDTQFETNEFMDNLSKFL